MHLVIHARGILNQVELWKILMQGQFWKWRRKNLKTGKDEITLVQGALRPSVLGAWEYIFPEEALAEVLAMLGLTEEMFKDKRLSFLRKIHGVKMPPKEIWKEVDKYRKGITFEDRERGLSNVVVNGVIIHPIGLKNDVRTEGYGYFQEML